MEKKLTILIAGAGIAGPALALLLLRKGHKCVIVERAPQFRSSGQQIDVSGHGVQIIKCLGIEDDLRRQRVEDDGLKFVDGDDTTIAEFAASSDSRSPVREIEILRPDFAGILYERTKHAVEYRFNERISELDQHDNGITVTFTNSKNTEDFDLVIAADGLRSSTRSLAFKADNTEIVSLGQYGAFFTIPWQSSDGRWSRWYNAPGGRTLCLRPNITRNITGAYLCQISGECGRIPRLSTEEQLEKITEIFGNAGWEADRILKAMTEGEAKESFYCQEVAQAKSKIITNGRVALLGDAGYCPSPVSGQGTTLALIGAYVLAGCITTSDDPGEALRRYESEMRPFIEENQKLLPGTPWIVNPQTKTGISVLNTALWLVGRAMNSNILSTLGKLGDRLPTLGRKKSALPDYSVLEAASSVAA